MGEIIYTTIQPKHVAGLAQLQIDCFPTLGQDELMDEAHFLSHLDIFPEGDFVALDGERVVGLGSGFFIDFDLEQRDHTFQEIIAGGYHTNHDPDGDYYYGADISVHPDFRGRGIGRQLYKLRKSLVCKYNRKGIVAGGLLPGFSAHKATISVQEYVDKVIAGELYDGTLTFQLKNGFVVMGLLQNYLEDSASDNWATLILWQNPSYTPQYS
ncbi:MAG: GNAT family N-acetyltransferase [Chloroflexi bacterium]|nr:GNAT family N-acetyltransferase [Chloroflexota bacterium]